MRNVTRRSVAMSGDTTDAAGDAPPRPCGAGAAGGCAAAVAPQTVNATRAAALIRFITCLLRRHILPWRYLGVRDASSPAIRSARTTKRSGAGPKYPNGKQVIRVSIGRAVGSSTETSRGD